MKAQIDDLVVWSTNSNWKLHIGVVYAIHTGRPYVIPILSDGTFGSKQECGMNYLVIARDTNEGVICSQRLAEAKGVWRAYLDGGE